MVIYVKTVCATQSEFGFVGLEDFLDYLFDKIPKIHKSDESKFRLGRQNRIA